MRDAVTTFQPFTKSISSVGNAQACAQGRGTVKVKTKVNDKEFQLTLKDVLYIPSNPQNLLSLGRWDKARVGKLHCVVRTVYRMGTVYPSDTVR